MSIVLACISVIVIACLNALIFRLLMRRAFSYRDSFKLTVVVTALNRCFFTGSGIAVASFFCREKKELRSKMLGTFLVMEALSVSLWLLGGIYFGARLAFEIPWYSILAAGIVFIMIFSRKAAWSSRIRALLLNMKEAGRRSILVFPLVLLSAYAYAVYYFFLFDAFGIHLCWYAILKVVSVSFSTGYLSPAPAGIGFREAGMIGLLMHEGVLGATAGLCALTDRMLTTLLWAAVGALAGFGFIKEGIRRRKRAKNNSTHG